MKRKDGDGTFRKKPNGRIEYAVSFGNDIYGKRIRKSFSGKTEAECRRKAKEYENAVQSQAVALSEYTFSSWCKIWIERYKTNGIQKSTTKEYQRILNIACKHKIGSMKMTDIKPIHILSLYEDCADYSSSTLHKMQFLIKDVFEDAIDNDICYRNPAKKAKAVSTQVKQEKEPYTEQEVDEIIKFAEIEPEFGVFIRIMLEVGLRSGEVRALRPQSIDVENCALIIDKAIKEDGVIGPPKNGCPRTVPVRPDLIDFIINHTDMEKQYLLGGEHFVSKDGFLSRYETFFRHLNTYCKEKGKTQVEYKPPHHCRHTCSTLMQRRGVPMQIVSRYLGHKSLEVTDNYTHLNTIDDLKKCL